MIRLCLRCGRPSADGESYCTYHLPARTRDRKTPGRGSSRSAARFRSIVIGKAAQRCQAIENGVRCEVRGSHKLEAHHDPPVAVLVAQGKDPSDPAYGIALCRRHHEMAEAQLNADPDYAAWADAEHG